MPLRYLETKSVQQKLMDLMDETETDTNRLCFELSPELLLNGTNVHSTVIEQLRNRGFHFMLTDFGGINSPLMKLAYFPVDYVMLSQEMISYLGKDERSLSAVSSIVDFIEGMEADVIADGVANLEQAEQLFKARVRFGAGSLAGRYMTERYLRRKKAEPGKAADEDADETVETDETTDEAVDEAVDEASDGAVDEAADENSEGMTEAAVAGSENISEDEYFSDEAAQNEDSEIDESLFTEE